MPKKQTQRGCALSKRRRKQNNKSIKQRGGNLHKMYNINTLAQDPQRMTMFDRGVVQAGGKKHGHSRKYLKHGGSGLNYSAMDQIVYKTMTPFMVNNMSNSVAIQRPAYI
uniref:Uncharacterized protein n=1 Tax=viral metagenome TaxID=1070528 RepID=A0A6C0B7I6_9ZZZZ